MKIYGPIYQYETHFKELKSKVNANWMIKLTGEMIILYNNKAHS